MLQNHNSIHSFKIYQNWPLLNPKLSYGIKPWRSLMFHYCHLRGISWLLCNCKIHTENHLKMSNITLKMRHFWLFSNTVTAAAKRMTVQRGSEKNWCQNSWIFSGIHFDTRHGLHGMGIMKNTDMDKKRAMMQFFFQAKPRRPFVGPFVDI